MSHIPETTALNPAAGSGREDSNQVVVSVIMITYNQEDTIDEAVRGVLSQKTEFGYELIIADDASTDSTPEHVSKWASMYPDRVVAIRRRGNLGLQRNFLDALSRVRGRYIAICEGDDWWCSSRKLARQVSHMESNPNCAVCFHRVVNYYEDDGTMSLSGGGIAPRLTLADLARANVITNLSVMYRRSAFPGTIPDWVSELRLFDYALHMLFASSGEIHYLSQPMAVYRQRGAGIWSGGGKEAQLRMAMATRMRLIGYFEDKAGSSDDDLAVKKYRATLNNLIHAMTQIGLSLLLCFEQSGNDSDGLKSREIKELVFKYNKDWDEVRLAEELNKRRIIEAGMHKGGLKKLTTGVRRAVSRLLPLPRIRGGVKVPLF